MLYPQQRVVVVPLVSLQGLVAPAALDRYSCEILHVFIFLEALFSLIVVLALFALCDRFVAFGRYVAWTARRTFCAVCIGQGRWWIGEPMRLAFADPCMVIDRATDRAPVSSNPMNYTDRASGPDTI
jgi:hypothetical protein